MDGGLDIRDGCRVLSLVEVDFEDAFRGWSEFGIVALPKQQIP
jgi:hypothetical protein